MLLQKHKQERCCCGAWKKFQAIDKQTLGFCSGDWSVQTWEGVISVQLSYMKFNQNIVFYRVSISHESIRQIWPKFYHSDYVSCLIDYQLG